MNNGHITIHKSSSICFHLICESNVRLPTSRNNKVQIKTVENILHFKKANITSELSSFGHIKSDKRMLNISCLNPSGDANASKIYCGFDIKCKA